MTIFSAVIFDLDNTLYDEKTLLYAVCLEFCKRYNLEFSHIESMLKDDFLLESKDIFGDWLKHFGFFTKERQEELFYLYGHLETPLELYEDALEIISFLQKRGIKLGILTNGALTSQMHKVKLLKLESLGLKVCYARANGKEYEKPHIDAFSRALAMLDSAPSTCLFVGDNPRTDILGANNAGLTSVHLQRGYGALIPCTNASRTITHLTQIKDYW